MVTRPALLYGSQCWTLKQMQEKMINVGEMILLSGMTRTKRNGGVENEKV